MCTLLYHHGIMRSLSQWDRKWFMMPGNSQSINTYPSHTVSAILLAFNQSSLLSELASELIRQLKEYFAEIQDRLGDTSFKDKRKVIDSLTLVVNLTLRMMKG